MKIFLSYLVSVLIGVSLLGHTEDVYGASKKTGAKKKKIPAIVKSFTVNTGDGTTRITSKSLTLPIEIARQGVSVIVNVNRRAVKPRRFVLSANGISVSQSRAPFVFFRRNVSESSFRALSVGTFVFRARPFIAVPGNKKLKGLRATVLTVTVTETVVTSVDEIPSPTSTPPTGEDLPASPTPTETPTQTPTATATSTPTVTPTPTHTITPWPTVTPTVTPTPTPTQLPRKESPFTLEGPPSPETIATIPEYQKWTERMRSYGEAYCNADVIANNPTAPGFVWEFDGVRAYYNIYGLTGNAAWLMCAGYVRDMFREYVLASNGIIPGHRVYPVGLLFDWRETGSPESKEAIKLLARNSVFSARGGDPDVAYSIETANLINAYLASEEVGEPKHPNVPVALNYALGHLHQWRDGFSGDFQPYLVAITLDALINWYVATDDPRMPSEITATANWLWDTYWDPVTESFPLIVCEPGSTNPDCTAGLPGVDLNLLFAHIYQWIGKTTGDTAQIARAKLLWASGVNDAYLGEISDPLNISHGRAKRFSQNYSLSFRMLTFSK